MNLQWLLSPELAYRVGWTLLHSLWQGTALALLLAAAMAAMHRNSARVRYVVALGAMIILIVALGITFQTIPAPPMRSVENAQALPAETAAVDSLTVPSSATPETSHEAAVVTAAAPSLTPSAEPLSRRLPVSLTRGIQPALPWIAGGWGVGVLMLSLWHLGGWIAVQRLKVLRVEPVAAEVMAIARRLTARLKLTAAVRIMRSVRVDTPVVIGWLRPIVLVPAAVLSELTPPQVEAILAHELAHIRRHDYLLNLFQIAIETLLFYHPAVWWISRRIRLEREQCCDDIAVTACGDRRCYVESLAALEEVRMAGAMVLPASGSGASQLLVRIRRLLGLGNDAPTCGIYGMAAGAVIVVLATVLIASIRSSGADEQPATRATDQTKAVSASNQHPGNGPRISINADGRGTTVIGISLKGPACTDQELARVLGTDGLEGLMSIVLPAEVYHGPRPVLTDITMLDLTDGHVTDAGLEPVARMIGLRTINLNGTQISNAGLAHLAGLGKLQTLILSGTKITDVGLEQLSAFGELERLDLSFTKVSDAGLEAIGGLPKLRRLGLNLTNVTAAGLKNFQREFPKVKVEYATLPDRFNRRPDLTLPDSGDALIEKSSTVTIGPGTYTVNNASHDAISGRIIPGAELVLRGTRSATRPNPPTTAQVERAIEQDPTVASFTRDLLAMEVQRDVMAQALGPEHKSIKNLNQTIELTRKKAEARRAELRIRYSDQQEQPAAGPSSADNAAAGGGSGPPFVDAIGNIVAPTMEIRTQMDGAVKQVAVGEGDRVKKGQLLVQLDDAQLRAAARTAEAHLKLGSVELQRVREMYKAKVAGDSELQKAEAELSLLEVDAEAKTQALQVASMRAPFDGVISNLSVQAGQVVNKGESLATVIAVDSLGVEIHVPERDLSRVRAGQKVELTAEAYPDEKFIGEVRFVSPELVASRTGLVKAQVANPESKLKPGMFGQVRIELGK